MFVLDLFCVRNVGFSNRCKSYMIAAQGFKGWESSALKQVPVPVARKEAPERLCDCVVGSTLFRPGVLIILGLLPNFRSLDLRVHGFGKFGGLRFNALGLEQLGRWKQRSLDGLVVDRCTRNPGPSF